MLSCCAGRMLPSRSFEQALPLYMHMPCSARESGHAKHVWHIICFSLRMSGTSLPSLDMIVGWIWWMQKLWTGSAHLMLQYIGLPGVPL